MIFELWYYKATLPNSGAIKARPVLIIGNDEENNLTIVDVHYCIVSATAPIGKYDVEIDEETAKQIGLSRASVIKTTKIFTGSSNLLERKISSLPDRHKKEFLSKYKDYQSKLIQSLE